VIFFTSIAKILSGSLNISALCKGDSQIYAFYLGTSFAKQLPETEHDHDHRNTSKTLGAPF
jgi:hypothetical protein